jgi:hypothetical protein
MIIVDPGRTTNGDVSRKVVSMLDIYPTIAKLAGVSVPQHLDGRSLEPLLDSPNDPDWDFPIVIRYMGTNVLKTNAWRFVDKGDKSQLYDMVNDPYEFNNLYADPQYAARVRTLRQQLLDLTGGPTYLGLADVPDVVGNGSPEVAAIRRVAGNGAEVVVSDSVTKQAVGMFSVSESGLQPVDLSAVRDVSGNGYPELAALFRKPDGQAVVQLKDAATGSETGTLRYFGMDWDVAAVTDVDRGHGTPEIAVLGIREDDRQGAIQVRSTADPMALDTIYLPVDPAGNYRDVAALEDSNGNGQFELAALSVLANGMARVVIMDGTTKKKISTVDLPWTQPGAVAIGVAGIGDLSRDGSADFAVLFRKANGQGAVRVHDAGTGRFISQMSFFDLAWKVVALTDLDSNGNGVSDLAVLAVRDNGQSAAVQIRDAGSGQALNWIGLPSGAN